jgi:serine/threonine kinase 16
MADEEITSVAKTTGNIMIDDDGRAPILMDLRSTCIAPSPIAITARSLAISV